MGEALEVGSLRVERGGRAFRTDPQVSDPRNVQGVHCVGSAG